MRTGLLREARLSREALARNLSELLVEWTPDEVTVDVRADAYGHGLDAVVACALEFGIRRFRVSDGARLVAGATAVSRDIPSGPSERAAYGLSGPDTAVMSLIGEVLAVKHVPRGSGVSYGYSYRTTTDGTLALVSLGYADGVPRLGSNVAHAAVDGVRAPIAGRIAMDQFVLDLGENTASVGDEVTVWGAPHTGAPSAADWAELTRRSVLDLTTGLARRVERTWVDG
jgi:alanine racemase